MAPPILALATNILSASCALFAVVGGTWLFVDTLVGWARYGVWIPTTMSDATGYRVGWLSDVALAVAVVAAGSIASFILVRLTYAVAAPTGSKS